MATRFHVVVASVTDTKFNGEADSITVPGIEGVMTILANHEPLVTTLKKGKVTVRAGGEVRDYEVEGGVVECSGNKTVVLL
jgi:F-type H+-transporting ATPase subunit epsilon